MNKDYEKRMMIVFVISFVVLLVSLFFMPKQQETVSAPVTPTVQQTNTQAPVSQMGTQQKSPIVYKTDAKATNILLSRSNEMFLTVNTYGGRIEALSIDGDWNRKDEPVLLTISNMPYKPGDLYFGSLETLSAIGDRPTYAVVEHGENFVRLSGQLNYMGSELQIDKSFSIGSNYQIEQEISIRNLSKEPTKIEMSGKAFTVGAGFHFMDRESANSGNITHSKYFDGREIRDALTAPFFQPKERVTAFASPAWLTAGDNYFIVFMKPQTPDFSGKFILLTDENAFTEVAFGLEYPPLLLNAGERKDFKVSYYVGPKKEEIFSSIDQNYGKILEWPIVFNWFMKPIEWLLSKGMWLFSTFIPNWGLIIILLALIIKLLLSPLSIQAAVSVKRMNLLQPKLKALQEKYKDNQQELQMKMAELYKKEGVNPLGGCLPMLLQIPVFFALFRVLSTSVELKGADFLWIKDLTQPDTLFKITQMPIIGGDFSFNLLPIIMTAIQLIQMKLQSTKNPTAQQGGALNTYILPIVFLFLFWGMPSGLVLYWTIQNVYTIFEQEFINLDKHVKLK